jgi:DNA-binding NarL/FixJ family response regulator
MCLIISVVLSTLGGFIYGGQSRFGGFDPIGALVGAGIGFVFAYIWAKVARSVVNLVELQEESLVLLRELAGAAAATRPSPTLGTVDIRLTPEEKRLIELVAEETSITQMAGLFRTTEEKVIVNLSQLRQRFGTHSNIQLVKAARELGYLSRP